MKISCFFFQAEDGIRDTSVTGVQTCALPIWALAPYQPEHKVDGLVAHAVPVDDHCAQQPERHPVAQLGGFADIALRSPRSEERRVGKECRSRRSPYHEKKRKKRETTVRTVRV